MASSLSRHRVVCSAKVGPFTVIESGSTIGNYTEVSNSVIGSNVSVDGCYIWNNVIIEDGCRLKHAVVCDGVIMKSGAILEPGVVLSLKVRDYIHVVDLADGHIVAVNKLADPSVGMNSTRNFNFFLLSSLV